MHENSVTASRSLEQRRTDRQESCGVQLRGPSAAPITGCFAKAVLPKLNCMSSRRVRLGCPLWTPSAAQVHEMRTCALRSSIQRATCPAKVRNASRLGSHRPVGPTGPPPRLTPAVPKRPFIPNILQVVVRPQSPFRKVRRRGATRTPRVHVGGHKFLCGISKISG